MAYATLLTHLDLEAPNDGVLAVTAELAQRFSAQVIGIAACQPAQFIHGAGLAAVEVYDLDRREIADEMSKAEAEFRKALAGKAADIAWRQASLPGSLAGYISDEARAADLIITQPDRGSGLVSASRRVSIGDLAMWSGRPLLIVPDGVRSLDLSRIMIAWKDTREARRAASDALPLLRLANEVKLVEIADADDLPEVGKRLDEVAAWLTRHGVKASAEPRASDGMDVVHLAEIAHEARAGLMVAGAYGHNRLREWVFGGVTCDLLMHPDRCTLVSH